MALALESARIPNGNGELWKGRDKSKFNQCECCPYGYHIDLDFVRFCENVSERNDASLNKERRRERRRQRQSMEVLLGLTSQSFWNLEQQLPQIPQEPQEPAVLEEESTLVRDALHKAVQDFEDTLERTHKKHDHVAAADVFTDVQTEAASSGDTSLSSMSAVSSPLTPQYVENEAGMSAAAHEALLQDFDVASIGSATSGHSHAALQNIRQQMALSLERMRDLEEQVKLIPVLQVHLAVAKEEKRKMSLLLQENKLERYNKAICEMKESQLDDTSAQIFQSATKNQDRKSRRDSRREDTGGRKSRQADDKVPLLKPKPKCPVDGDLLLPANMWLLDRQMELMVVSEKPLDTQYETAARTQLSTYKLRDSPVTHYDYFPSHSSQMETKTKRKKSDSTPLPATGDGLQRGAHPHRQPDMHYIMKPKVVYPTTHNIDAGARRKDKSFVHPETPADYVWNKTEYDGGDHHERRHRHGLTRQRSRSVSEVVRPKEPYHKDTSTLRRDKPKRDVQVQTVRQLIHVSTQSDIHIQSGGQTKAPVVTGHQTQTVSSTYIPKDILAYTIKLSVQAFDSYLNQCEGSLMRSRFVNKQDQIDIYKGTLEQIMGTEGLVVDSTDSSSSESLVILKQSKAPIKKVSLKTLDEPRKTFVTVASRESPTSIIKFTSDRGTSCRIALPCQSCLNKTPDKTVIQGVRKNVFVQTKPIEPVKVPVKPTLRDQGMSTDELKLNIPDSAAGNTKPEINNAYTQTMQAVEESKSVPHSMQGELDNLQIDIGIECTIDDFRCTKCKSTLEKVRKTNMKSKLVQTNVILVKETPAVLDIPKFVVQPSSVKHSAEKGSEVSREHTSIDSPPSKGTNVSLVNIEDKMGGDVTKSAAENTTKCILDVTPETLKPVNPMTTKPIGMTKYVNESLAEPKFTKKAVKTVFTQTEIRELLPSKNMSTNTLKMKMVDRRVGETLPLPKYECTTCGSLTDEKDRESKIPRPASSDPARKLQRQTTYTKLDVPDSVQGLWTSPSDLSLNQGSELWPSVPTTVYNVEESEPDVSDEKTLPRDDGSRPRRSGASSSTTSTSSLSWSGKQSYDAPSELQSSTASVKSTDSSEKCAYLPGSSEIRKEEIGHLYKSPLPSESEESSMHPYASEASKFDVTAGIELTRTHGPIKPTVQPYVSHRQVVHRNPNETPSVGISRLSKLLERPRPDKKMALPYPFASPSLESDVAKKGNGCDSESTDVSPAESLMSLPRPFNSPSLFDVVQDNIAKQNEEQHDSAKGKSGCAKADVSATLQSRGVRHISQPRVSQTIRHVGKQQNDKDNVSTGKKMTENTEPADVALRRPKPLVLSPSDQKEAYEVIKKDRTSPEHGALWGTHDSPQTSRIPSMPGTSTSSDGFTLQSKEDILNLSASERPEKIDPSTKMKAALKVVNDMIVKSPTMSELGNTAKAANAIIQREWFQISSTPSADPHIVEDYLDHFEEMSSTLLTYVVNMADKAGNTAMHYALSQGNFDVVSILLDSKVCNINLPNAAGYTAVMLVSLAQIRSDTHRCVLQRFLANADVNVRAQQHGQTALMLAVSHNRLDMVQLLIEGGADLNIQDEDGSTALMCAAEHGHAAIVQFVINQPDADVNIKDVDGLTALDIALDAGHKDVGILLYAYKHFSRTSSPYASLRGRRSKSATPTTRTASTPPPRTPGSPLPARPPRHSHD